MRASVREDCELTQRLDLEDVAAWTTPAEQNPTCCDGPLNFNFAPS